MKPLSEQSAIVSAVNSAPDFQDAEVARFIVAARNDYPALIEWAKKSRQWLECIQEWVKEDFVMIDEDESREIAKLLEDLQP